MSKQSNDLYITCPECGRPTNSMKAYTLPGLTIFLIVAAHMRHRKHVCCPHCMRKKILLHGFTYNIITAHLLWLILIMPWSVINFLRSFTKGHSREVYRML